MIHASEFIMADLDKLNPQIRQKVERVAHGGNVITSGANTPTSIKNTADIPATKER